MSIKKVYDPYALQQYNRTWYMASIVSCMSPSTCEGLLTAAPIAVGRSGSGHGGLSVIVYKISAHGL